MRALAALVCLLALSACHTEHTEPELLVVVDSDLPDLTDVNVDVTSGTPEAGAATTQHNPVHLGGATHLPIRFAVLPQGHDATRVVTVSVTGLTTGTVRVRNYAVTSFVPDEVRRLDLFLGRDCTDPALTCEERMQVCRHGMCVSPNVDPTTLPRVDVDAGAVDAAATDAPGDAGLDAPPFDAGPVLDPLSGQPCDASAGCGPLHACGSIHGEAPLCRRLTSDPDGGVENCQSSVGRGSGRERDDGNAAWVCSIDCDPLRQTGCVPGTTCDQYTGEGHGITDCRPIGGVPGNGACTSMEDCAAALNCFGISAAAYCVPFCDPATAPCGPGIDCAVDPYTGAAFCVPSAVPGLPCNPDAGVAGDAGCPAGFDCATGTRGVAMCRVPCGTASPPSFCVSMVGYTSECEFDPATTGYHCTAACDPIYQLGCPAGTACDIYPTVYTDCRAASSGMAGAMCASASLGFECAPLYDCYGGDGMCHELCIAGTTTCGGGLGCTPYSGSFPDGTPNHYGFCN